MKCSPCASAVRAVISTQLCQNLSHIILKPNRLVGVVDSGKRHWYQCGQGWMYTPPTIFKHVFDEYNFSIISNLFDNNKPYTLSTHNRKCTNKIHHIFSETLRFRGINFEQNLSKNCSKSTKMATIT